MTLQFTQLLLAIAVFQSILFGLFAIAGKKYVHRSYAILGFLLLFQGLVMLDELVQATDYRQFMNIGNTFVTLLSPFFYFYVRSVTDADYRLGKTQWAHGLPFLAIVVYVIVAYHSKTEDEQWQFMSQAWQGDVWHSLIIPLALHLQFLVYAVLSIRYLTRFNLSFRDRFSQIETRDLSWLRLLIVGYLVIWINSFLYNFLGLAIDTAMRFSAVQNVYSLIFINVLIYKVFISDKLDFVPPVPQPEKAPAAVYGDQVERLIGRLRELMSRDKPFLSPRLTIEELAQLADMEVHDLSKLLNDDLGQNFYDFVNRYRIEHSKFLLAVRKDMSVLDLMLESGFNSKSSFNSAFKKYTAQTPTQFRRTEAEAFE